MDYQNKQSIGSYGALFEERINGSGIGSTDRAAADAPPDASVWKWISGTGSRSAERGTPDVAAWNGSAKSGTATAGSGVDKRKVEGEVKYFVKGVTGG